MGAGVRDYLEGADSMKPLLGRNEKPAFRVINFSDDCHNKGMNMTVRRGIRKATAFKPGDIATVKGPRTIRTGKVVSVKVKKFCDITEEEIRVHHQIESKKNNETLQDYLDRLMNALYTDFDQNEICTLIFYQVNGKHIKMERR